MTTPLKCFATTPELEAALADLKAVIAKHAHLTALELLALASQIVGNLIALQDQRSVTSAMAMELVIRNIEEGNATAIAAFLGNPEGAA